jgi:hypothetical protein
LTDRSDAMRSGRRAPHARTTDLGVPCRRGRSLKPDRHDRIVLRTVTVLRLIDNTKTITGRHHTVDPCALKYLHDQIVDCVGQPMTHRSPAKPRTPPTHASAANDPLERLGSCLFPRVGRPSQRRPVSSP